MNIPGKNAVWLAMPLLLCALAARMDAATVTLDGAQTNQIVDGFGVNANYWSYTNHDLEPVLDALIDQAGMTIFRVVFNNGWEATNDNDDPDVMNQGYYNALYSGPEFEKLWGLIGYLNQKGITNGVMLNFQGPGPDWMGGGTLTPGMEDEWAEMIVSLLAYARNTRHLQFSLVAPNNEPDITSEGINIPTVAQYLTTLRSLARLLDTNGLGDFRFVAPDRSDSGTNWLPEMMSDPTVMAKLGHFGLHSYFGDGGGSVGVDSRIQQTPYRDRSFWMTEFNVWCEVCEHGGAGTNGWPYFRDTADYLFGHLANNASAGLVWEGYDSFYPHHDAWSFWGLFAVDSTNAAAKTYTPRKNFYTLAQFSKFIRPGARRIGASGSLGLLEVLAFYHDNLNQLILTGINTGTGPVTLSGTLSSLPAIPALDLYYTSSSVNLNHSATASVTNNSFVITIPGDCVFTLVGNAALSVAITNPPDGAHLIPPANIAIEAMASASVGSVSKVEFFSGTNKLGESTAAPYGMVWSNVSQGLFSLSARASNTLGQVGFSPPVQVAVVGPPAQIKVAPATAALFPSSTQQFIATLTDAFGTSVTPQPDFTWSANHGGVIDSVGSFTAGNNVGGPFAILARGGGFNGQAAVMVTTNLAATQTGYIWYNLASPSANTPRAAAPGINDGDLGSDIPLTPGGALDSPNAYEAAGVVSSTLQSVSQVLYWNGSYTFDENGVFASSFQLQFSMDGTTWTPAGPEWTVTPAYIYNSPFSANQAFTFSGGNASVRGVRCLGRVRTSEVSPPPNSWMAYATEVQALAGATALRLPPVLNVLAQTNHLIISWSGPATNCLVETSSDLASPNAWSTVTNTVQTIGEVQFLDMVPSAYCQLFRLRQY